MKPQRFRPAWIFALFLLGSVLLYAHTFNYPFVFDDLDLIPNHPALRDPSAIAKIFGGLYWGGSTPKDVLYRPLTIWSLALNRGENELLGRAPDDPRAYRLTNALLHGAVAGLLYLLALALGLRERVGLLAAMLFLVHPVHTEVVDAVVYRSESLAAFFGLAALLAARRGGGAAAFAGLCLALAAFSKESGIAFLALIPWMEHGFGRRARPLTLYVAALGGLALWAALRAHAIGGAHFVPLKLDNPLVGAAPLERVMSAVSIQGRYLGLLVAPLRLSSDYSYLQIPVVRSPLDAWLALALAAAAFAAWGAWRLRGGHPVFLFALGAYLVLFLPASNLVFPIGTVMAERLAYAPSVAFCLAVGWGADLALSRRGKPLATAWAALLVVFVFLTVQRNTTWNGVDVFFRTQVATAPQSAKAHYNNGRRLQLAENFAGAEREFRRATEILPDYAVAWNNLGAMMLKRVDPGDAADCFRRAVALDPRNALAETNLGLALAATGRRPEAMDAYRRALEVDPRRTDAMNLLGIALADSGDLAGAEGWWRRALEVDPGFEPARTNLERLAETRR